MAHPKPKKPREDLDYDPATSIRMGQVWQHGTRPELAVRRLLSQLGFRYRLHNRDLPGSPDIANRTQRWAVFVHGRFWHAHPGCPRATVPKRNRRFWLEKFAANRERDALRATELRKKGFKVIVVWECQLAEPKLLKRRLAQELSR